MDRDEYVSAYDLFDSEDEWIEFCESVKGLADVWNYPSTEDEKRLCREFNSGLTERRTDFLIPSKKRMRAMKCKKIMSK